jgi:DNA-binding NarL/FixJ family response regulator
VVKGAPLEELYHAIRLVAAGTRFLSPQIAEVLWEDLLHIDAGDPATAANNLTPREREIVQLLAEGNSGKEIAQRLSLSPSTVESYRKQIMAKLDLHSVVDLTRYAIREGFITP